MNENQLPDSNFKVAPFFTVLLTLIFLILTIFFSILTITKIDFSKLSTSTNNPTTNQDSSQTTLQVNNDTNTDQTTDRPLTAADIASAKKVSDAYIVDLQQLKTDAAFKLESPNYQKTRSQRPEMLHPSLYVPSSTPVVDAQATTKTLRGDPDFVIVYRFRDDNGKPFYIQVLVENLNGKWLVHGFTASPDHLNASY